jgi:hypothetical protein
MGVLWRHSNVNLVKPRSIALAGPRILRRLPKINEAVSITESPPQPAQPIFGIGISVKCEEFAAFLTRDNFALTITRDT